MSVCFYNTKGWMVGIDVHMFQMAVPPDPLPVTMPFFPHAVGVKLSWGFCSEKSKLKNVTSDGAPMLQKGHKLKMVPHVFVPCALPHPLEAVQIAAVIASSKTTCVMGVESVTGGGAPLATCLIGFWGLNVDCSSPVDIPSGNVFNGNTVRTSPSAADYVNAGIDVAFGAIEKAIELLIEPLVKKPNGENAEWFETYKDWRERQENLDQVIKYIQRKVPSASDIEEHLAKIREDIVHKLLGGH